jgi:hypothetical protein
MKEWRKENLHEERKNNARGCVKFMGLDMFFWLCLTFLLE